MAVELRDAVTVEGYTKIKKDMEVLIEKQPGDSRGPLTNALKFWDESRKRWATAYKSALHAIPRSSLAEVAHASTTAAGDKGLSLVDSVFADIVDSARLQAKWENRSADEKSTGKGPSGIDLEDRDESRQIGRAKRFIAENSMQESSTFMEADSQEEFPWSIYILDPRRTHRPDKRGRLSQGEKRSFSRSSSSSSGNELSSQIHSTQSRKKPKISTRRQRSITSKAFTSALKRAHQYSAKILVTGISKFGEESAKIKVEEEGVGSHEVTFRN